MKRSSRIAAVAATSVMVVLVLLAVLPLFFSDRIAQRVQVEVNRNVNARVSWRHAGLSFFRNFPNLSLTLDDLAIAGLGRTDPAAISSDVTTRCAVSGASPWSSQKLGKKIW